MGERPARGRGGRGAAIGRVLDGTPPPPDLLAVRPRSWPELARDPAAAALPLVAEADVSQLAVVDAVSRGAALLAVECPPGTGRLRTIANVLARAAASGRRALFIASSPDALEGVRRELIPPPAPAPAALTREETQALEKARSGLDAAAQALHEVHWPLDRSLADVLGELAGLHDVPTLAWRLRDPEVLTEEQLAEIEELAEGLDAIPAAVRQDDFPWRRLADGAATEAPRAEWLELLGRARRATRAAREAAEDAARRRGAAPETSPAELRRQVDLSDLRGAGPPVPAHWVRDLDLAAAREEAQHWGAESARQRSVVEGLKARFQPALFDLPEADLEGFDRAGMELQALVGRPPGAVLENRSALSDFLEAVQKALPGWGEAAERLAAAVRWEGFVPSMDGLSRLARIALLFHGPDRPRREWLDRNRAARAEVAIRELDACYARYRAARRALLVDYRPSAAELDAEAMLERFRRRWRGPLRVLQPGYHRDRARLRAHRAAAAAPSDPERDLARIKAFRQQATRLEPQRRRFQALLGTHDPGPAGSLDGARRALAAAREVLDLLTDPAALESMSGALGDDAPAPEVAALAEWLESSVAAVRSIHDRARDVLPPGRVDGEETDLLRLPLARLGPWVARARLALTGLAARHGMVAGLRASPEVAPPGYDDVLDLITELAAVRSFDRALAQAAGHLHAVYGRLFTGRATDWAAVVAALDRAEALRERLGETAPDEPSADGGLGAGPGFEDLRDRLREAEGLYEKLQQSFDQAHARRRHPVDPHQTWDAIDEALATLESRVDERQAWLAYARLRSRFEAAGLWALLEELEPERAPPLDRRRAARKAALSSWCDHHLAAAAALRPGREALAQEFRALDRRQREAATAALAATVREAISGRGTGPAAVVTITADRLLEHQETSPFDLVAIDESVPLPLDRVREVLDRCGATVVFGDSVRLPGTTERATLLGRWKAAGVPVVRLAFQHRARAGPVVAFARSALYGGQLIAVPPADRDASARVRVVTARRGGQLEAVLSVVENGAVRPAPVTVIAPPDLVDRLRAATAGRSDVTVGGPDGAASAAGGTVIVCAGDDDVGAMAEGDLAEALQVPATELVVIATEAEGGPPLLRQFLDHVARHPRADDAVRPSPLRREIAAALRAPGLEVEHEPGGGAEALALGAADPRRPGRFVLGVDCDDSPARASWPARDRVRLRAESLRAAGWSVVEASPLEWALDREGARKRLEAALAAAAGAAPAPVAPPERDEVVPYVAASLPAVSLARPLAGDANRETLRDLLGLVVAAEGPVHREIAAARVLAACGTDGRGRKAARIWEEALARALEAGMVREEGGFLLSPEAPRRAVVRVPSEGAPVTRRSARHIPPDEVRRAAAVVRRRRPALEGEALVREVAQLLGLARLDRRARGHFRAALSPEAADR